jgi:hypothetical protein
MCKVFFFFLNKHVSLPVASQAPSVAGRVGKRMWGAGRVQKSLHLLVPVFIL